MMSNNENSPTLNQGHIISQMMRFFISKGYDTSVMQKHETGLCFGLSFLFAYYSHIHKPHLFMEPLTKLANWTSDAKFSATEENEILTFINNVLFIQAPTFIDPNFKQFQITNSLDMAINPKNKNTPALENLGSLSFVFNSKELEIFLSNHLAANKIVMLNLPKHSASVHYIPGSPASFVYYDPIVDNIQTFSTIEDLVKAIKTTYKSTLPSIDYTRDAIPISIIFLAENKYQHKKLNVKEELDTIITKRKIDIENRNRDKIIHDKSEASSQTSSTPEIENQDQNTNFQTETTFSFGEETDISDAIGVSKEFNFDENGEFSYEPSFEITESKHDKQESNFVTESETFYPTEESLNFESLNLDLNEDVVEETVNVCDMVGGEQESALLLAVMQENIEEIQILLANQADPYIVANLNYYQSKLGEFVLETHKLSPLCCAIINQLHHAFSTLIAANVDIHHHESINAYGKPFTTPFALLIVKNPEQAKDYLKNNPREDIIEYYMGLGDAAVLTFLLKNGYDNYLKENLNKLMDNIINNFRYDTFARGQLLQALVNHLKVDFTFTDDSNAPQTILVWSSQNAAHETFTTILGMIHDKTMFVSKDDLVTAYKNIIALFYDQPHLFPPFFMQELQTHPLLVPMSNVQKQINAFMDFLTEALPNATANERVLIKQCQSDLDSLLISISNDLAYKIDIQSFTNKYNFESLGYDKGNKLNALLEDIITKQDEFLKSLSYSNTNRATKL